ncbi:MAG: cytochrome o ubiquinol oxidase subunit III [Candidatus Saccharimonadales bacterium]
MIDVVKAAHREAESERDTDDKSLFGFWVYLMTDCVLFATLFATYAVLRQNTYGGPNGRELFSLHFVLAETLILLTSSFTCGLAMLAAQRKQKDQVLGWLFVTFLLGVAFLSMELNEFHKLALEGNSWRRSGFLSAFFTLVGTHGAHILTGLIWMATMMAQVYKHDIVPAVMKRLTLLSLFWHFLDVVWIFIFTVVYLYGAL